MSGRPRPLLGIFLRPDREFLAAARSVIESADFLEIAPAMGLGSDAGRRFRDLFLEMKRRSGKPFTAHGSGLSLGTAGESPRDELLLSEIRREHADFGFLWASEHLCFEEEGGGGGEAGRMEGPRNAFLPLPLPFTSEAARLAAGRLRRLKGIVPEAAFENNVSHFTLGPPRDEPAFWNEVAREADCWILLDLADAQAQCRSTGLDLGDFLDRIDLSRVIEIHLSGGTESLPEWTPSGRRFWLGSGDARIDEEVWAAFARILPRCVGLRGVALERHESSIGGGGADELARDFARAREMLSRSGPRRPASGRNRASGGALGAPLRSGHPALARHEGSDSGKRGRGPVPRSTRRGVRAPLARLQEALSKALWADDPAAALREAAGRESGLSPEERALLAGVDPDAFSLAGVMAKKLRFEQALRGDPLLSKSFGADPARFAALFRRYCREVPPRAFDGAAEARAFRRFAADAGEHLPAPACAR